MQALNTIGVEKNTTDSDMAVQVKAISLKALNQLKRHWNNLKNYSKEMKTPITYEIADLKNSDGR
ncbi:hypothetical protein Q2T40_03895 [Winogradskyella maritima]|nr:hypothetical protein [Winogradskyella maritima]